MRNIQLSLNVLLILAGLTLFGKSYASTFSFIENKGQIFDQDGIPRTDILYSASLPGMDCYITNTGIQYQFKKRVDFKGETVDSRQMPLKIDLPSSGFNRNEIYEYDIERIEMILAGANIDAHVEGQEMRTNYTNYFYQYRNLSLENVRHFTKIKFKDLYPGIDWIIYEKDGKLKYDFIIHPYADPSLIKIHFKGVDEISLNKQGKLFLKNSLGEILEDAPYTFYSDSKVVIDSKYIISSHDVSFEIANYNHHETIVIDPHVEWATYFGGVNDDVSVGLEVDNNGDIIMTGVTSSLNNIATTGAYQTVYGGGQYDIFLSRFDSLGNILWSTYYGGDDNDQGIEIALKNTGEIILVGYTGSQNGFSTSGSYQPIFGGGNLDAFLAEFSSSGSLQSCTYIGGDADDYGSDIFIDERDGSIYIAGTTYSAFGLASSGAYQSNHGGAGQGMDGFITKYNSQGVRLWSTYYGDDKDDYIISIKKAEGAKLVVCGGTVSLNGMASSGTHQQINGGSGNTIDAFVSMFDSSGVRIWGSYYGGFLDDQANCVIVGSSNDIYILGQAQSNNNISTLNSFKPYLTSNTQDGFIAKFDSTGTRIWATYYGGNGDDRFLDAKISPSGDILAIGSTSSTDSISTPNGLPGPLGFKDVMLLNLSTNGLPKWGGYWGAGGSEMGSKLELTSDGLYMYFTGETTSDSLATLGVHQQNYGGGPYDGVLVKLAIDSNVLSNLRNIEEKNLVVFPNPASTEIYIQKSNYEISTAVLKDMQGRVWAQWINPYNNKLLIPETVCPGVYILTLTNFNNEIESNKVFILAK